METATSQLQEVSSKTRARAHGIFPHAVPEQPSSPGAVVHKMKFLRDRRY